MYSSFWQKGGLLWVIIGIWLFSMWLNSISAVRVFDYRILTRVLDQTLESKQDIPIVLIATDSEFVNEYGCPPYNHNKLQSIEHNLKEIGIKQLILPRGISSFIKIDKQKVQSSLILYKIPYVLFWDTYSKKWQISKPPHLEFTQDINSISFLQFQYGGMVQQMPTPPKQIKNNLPIFPYYLAKLINKNVRHPSKNELIRFIGKAGSVPTLPLSRIIKADLSKQDTKGKIALLAITSGICAPQIPVPADSMGMSYAEIMANAAITLQKHPIVYLSTILEWLFVLLFMLVSTLILRRMKLAARIVSLFLLLSSWSVFALILAGIFNILVSFSMPLLSVLLIFLYLNIEHTFSIVRALRENNIALEKEVESFLFTPDILKDMPINTLFDQIVKYLKNFIPIQKAFLFILPEGRFHVKVVSAISCTEGEIRERRRDIRRRPWMDAISNPHGAFMEGFMKQKDLLTTYGVPILDFGKLLGVLVVVVNKDTQISQKKQNLLERTAFHLSSMLVSYEDLFTSKNIIIKLISTIKNADAIRQQLLHTSRITNRVISQIVKYRALIERVDLGVVFADIMGIVYYTNTAANRFFTNLGIGGQKNLITLLEHLSNSEQRARNILEAAISGDEIPSIEFEDKANRKVFLIKLSGLSVGVDSNEISMSGVSALQLTIFDITKNKQLDNLKSQALYLASFKGKNIITGLSGFASLIKMQTNEPEIQEFSTELEDLTQQLTSLFEEFATLAEKISIPAEDVVETPFDILSTIGEILEEISAEARRKNVELIQNMPIMCAPVIGDWVRIKEGISLLVRDILQSCFAGARIKITIRELYEGVSVEILDPSMTPTQQMIDSINNKNWDDLPEGMKQAFNAFDAAGINFNIEEFQNGGTLIKLLLPKL